MRFSKYALTLGVIALLLLGSPIFVSTGSADNGGNHQVLNNNLGVSGGNINDSSRRFCCSGTLGALVQDNTGALYILSNNHVLGRSDQANAGEDISQPGLIDNNCQVPRIVADFTTNAQLSSNVDAAIAALRPGTMTTDGFIQDIGRISSVVKTPAVGMSVVKSGRTTGFTTGTVGSINTSVSVQYQRGCSSGKKFVVSFTNQVVINSSTFSAGGDSGSLIVTNDSNHQPVALLYAGSSTTTIGNPAGEVLSKLSAELGRTLSFVGAAMGTSSASRELTITPFAQNAPFQPEVERAISAKMRHETDLMSRPGVLGVGVGDSETGSAEATIIVYVDRATGRAPALPERLENVRVRVILTDPFIAY